MVCAGGGDEDEDGFLILGWATVFCHEALRETDRELVVDLALGLHAAGLCSCCAEGGEEDEAGTARCLELWREEAGPLGCVGGDEGLEVGRTPRILLGEVSPAESVDGVYGGVLVEGGEDV